MNIMPNRMTVPRPICASALAILAAGLLLLWPPGCGSSPDTSAPERQVITRSADWRGALLYIADASGPTPGWGSIRVYDNVSGYVEKTVEQTSAAAPADVYVTPGESTMYVGSSGNGVIAKFHWDGNNWHDSGEDLDTPGTSVLALRAGPDGKLYAVDGSPAAGIARLFAVDPASGALAADALSIPQLAGATGIAWSRDGRSVFIPGVSSRTHVPVLLIASWPSLRSTGVIDLPLLAVHQAVTTPDGRFVFVMGRGQIIKVDVARARVTGSLKPAAEADADYTDADFSADGRYLFVTGAAPGGDSTLFVIDLTTGKVVKTVKHISAHAMGIQRVE